MANGNKDRDINIRKNKKKKNVKRRLLIALLIVIILFILLIGGIIVMAHHYVSKLNIVSESETAEILDSIEPDDDITSEPDSPQEEIDDLDEEIRKNLEENATEIKSDDNVFNILLIGTDARDKNSRGRSDSMILMSINKTTKKIVMTSFMRDIYLAIPGVESTRLNHAYAYGGADLLIDTIEQNFKVRIDRYVQVNFFSFITVVDAVGGVKIKVSDAEVKVLNNYLEEINSLEGDSKNDSKLSGGGTYTLNGKQALAYARIRYVGNADFDRTKRQREILNKVIAKTKKCSLTELNDLLNDLLPQVTTNLQEGEIYSLMLNSASYLGYDRVQARVPVDGSWSYLTIRGMSVLGLDFQENIDYLFEKIYE